MIRSSFSIEKLLSPIDILRLYTNSEIVPGTCLRAGSSKKDVALQEAQEDVQGSNRRICLDRNY